MENKALRPEDELAWSKSRLNELSQAQPRNKLESALDERLRDFHRRRVAEMTAVLSNNAAAAINAPLGTVLDNNPEN